MLTRLKVKGFKNLVDVDIRFGPFTCIAGVNGVGKSNLFDAIRFLSALADRPLLEAAQYVRDEGGQTGDVRGLFHRIENNPQPEMSFEAEMIIPSNGVDDLGQDAKAGITFLKYSLRLRHKEGQNEGSPSTLEIMDEELEHINKSHAARNLRFKHSKAWRDSVVDGRRTSKYISTKQSSDPRGAKIEVHQDGNAGRVITRNAITMQRTVLSSINTSETPTALLARREMQSWRLLQLEPSSLRKPDEFRAPSHLGADGSNLPATLYRLAKKTVTDASNGEPGRHDSTGVYSRIANRLSELIENVAKIEVDHDDKRELLTLLATNKEQTTLPARALSDGTLRFLALAVLEHDPQERGVICLEEPENGIHPERIPAMLKLLMDIAVDCDEPVGPDNPLRQVIANTHSPAVVAQVCDADLVIADFQQYVTPDHRRYSGVTFCCVGDTWRAKDAKVIARGRLLSYLTPSDYRTETSVRGRRVKDRREYAELFPKAPDEVEP